MVKKKAAWRKIDVQQEVDAVGDDALRDRVEHEVNLFSVDPKGRPGGDHQKRKTEAEWNVSAGERTRLRKVLGKLPTKKSPEKKCHFGNVYDLWEGDDVSNLGNLEGKSVSKRTLAPGVKLPHPGQSINPEMRSHLSLLESEAARVIEANRVASAVSAREAPLTTRLAEMLSQEKLSEMTLGEKQKALNDLFVRSKPHTENGVDVDDDCDANSAFKPTLLDADDEDSTGLTASKQPRKKSKGKRNKAARHAARVALTNAKKTEKLFLHSIQNAGSILKELKKRDVNIMKRIQYMRAHRLRLKEEEAKGDVSFKTGRNAFSEGPEGVPLIVDVAMSSGSLRAARIPVGASTVMERVKSVERQGLVELPAVGDELAHQRTRGVKLRRQALRSRKYINPLMRGAERKTRSRVLQSHAGLKMVNRSRKTRNKNNAGCTIVVG